MLLRHRCALWRPTACRSTPCSFTLQVPAWVCSEAPVSQRPTVWSSWFSFREPLHRQLKTTGTLAIWEMVQAYLEAGSEALDAEREGDIKEWEAQWTDLGPVWNDSVVPCVCV